MQIETDVLGIRWGISGPFHRIQYRFLFGIYVYGMFKRKIMSVQDENIFWKHKKGKKVLWDERRKVGSSFLLSVFLKVFWPDIQLLYVWMIVPIFCLPVSYIYVVVPLAVDCFATWSFSYFSIPFSHQMYFKYQIFNKNTHLVRFK